MLLSLKGHPGCSFTGQQAKEFCKCYDLQKDQTYRLFSWMIELKLVKPSCDSVASQIINFYNKYKEMVQQIPDPFTLLQFSDQNMLGIRILSFSIQNDYSYTQGYDRFLWISLSVSLVFANNFNFPILFAESIAYQLLIKLIQIGNYNDFLNLDSFNEYFDDLSSIISSKAPMISNKLSENGVSPFFYALKWRLILFADIHETFDILQLWDNMFLHIDNFELYFKYLCVAHLKQIQSYDEEEDLAEVIQSYKNWNLEDIIDDANEMMEPEYGINQFAMATFAFGASIANAAFDIGKKAAHKIDMKLGHNIVSDIYDLIRY
ncbi:hypothetical protein GPJ56_009293 [Histomonas meleagridis]|uniref:uncharacterized protein n=1 Tax=Histomonas meleagridis TaxID=135588 RepID=UPI003559BBAE|nr:hypothetical protein GPJ56_009293 [Histomonas meleagridis]KAH0797706.1 hypothetical protein GO595_009335 [Histomonas meleagridis]